jgi:predicted transcriptional regulator of viral defense system
VNQIEALRRLQNLGTPVFETRDAKALLGVTLANAHMILRRLAAHGLVTHLARGKWLSTGAVSRFALPELISAPYPAYVSMQSALFHHGLIEQVPAVVYAVTLGRPRRVTTPLAVISFHRLPPELFSGFEIADDGAKIATPEKALFDVLYLAPARSRLFARLPELDIPRTFRWSELQRFAAIVKSATRRVHIERRIAELQRSAKRPRAAAMGSMRNSRRSH